MSPGTPIPAALYLRVSSDRQTTENQRQEVEQLAIARGFVPHFYREEESAVKKRPQFDRMIADVRAGRMRAVVVWALDRLHRDMQRVIFDVHELWRLNVRVLSVQEAWLDAPDMVRPFMLAFVGWVAEGERRRLIERTKAGIERARAQGKQLGRPRVAVDVARARALLDERMPDRWGMERRRSFAQVAGMLGVPPRTLRRAIEREGEKGAADEGPK